MSASVNRVMLLGRLNKRGVEVCSNIMGDHGRPHGAPPRLPGLSWHRPEPVPCRRRLLSPLFWRLYSLT
jgi:hypothetical protein